MDVASKSSSGLSSLQIYESDSEQDEINEDEESGHHIPTSPRVKLKELKRHRTDDTSPVCTLRLAKQARHDDDAALPVPDIVKQMFSSSKENDEGQLRDDPSLHMGRIRSFPHARGNWASYVYLPCKKTHCYIDILIPPSLLLQCQLLTFAYLLMPNSFHDMKMKRVNITFTTQVLITHC